MGWRPEEEPMLQVGSDFSLETELRLPQGKSVFVSQSLQLIDEAHPHQGARSALLRVFDLHVHHICKIPSK